MRVAIIGAGIGGLAAARHALAAGNIDVTVFEQSDRIGGNWAYREQAGVDEYGCRVSSSAYPGLISNSPKETMCYPDIPYGNKEGSSFLLPGEVIGYLERFIQHFKIAPAIRLRHQVINIRPQPDTNAWTVTTRNILESTDTTAVFDAIMVCNGHYAVASFPDDLPGRDVFRGRQVHSHTFRGADEFAGQSVLVIGGGPSSQDIAWNIRNVTAKLRISAHGLGAEAMTTTFGKTVVRPDVAALTETGVRYADGVEEEFDTILYCTGYVYSFPFLDDECGITYRNNHVRPLYKQCVHIERPTLFFIGLTDFDLPAAIMDAQSRFVVSLLQNKWQLPVRKEMERIEAADLQRCWDLGYLERNAHRVYHFVADYVAELEEICGAETRVPPVLFKIFYHCEQRMRDEWSRFRREKVTIVDNETFTTEFYPDPEEAALKK